MIVSLSKQTCLMLRVLISDWSQWELELFVASLIHKKPSFSHGNLQEQIFHYPSLPLHLCHARIISVGWRSQSQEGRKEKPGTLWSGRWLWFFNKSVQVSSDSQMVQQMLSLLKSDKGQFQAPHETHEARASAGIAGALVDAGSCSFTWRTAPIPQYICNGWALLFQAQMGLAQDKRCANPKTSSTPLTMSQGWLCLVLRASTLHRGTRRPRRRLISCVTLCFSAWLCLAFTSWETA